MNRYLLILYLFFLNTLSSFSNEKEILLKGSAFSVLLNYQTLFCAGVIAFGHGMTTPVVEWDDKDMRKNKDSEYYVGDYYSINGGIPTKFSEEVKMKPLYKYVYFDCRFNLPLYQLVYNNSVITSHHWE